MKKDIHPEDYRSVVFQDSNAQFSFLTRSTVRTTETIEWEDGNEYPLFKLDISSASHPFYTVKQTYIDAAGRVEKFQKRHSWDNSTLGKVLEKEAPKKKPRKVEKVTVGLPKLKKKKADEEEEEAPKGKGRKGGRGGKGVTTKAPSDAAAKTSAADSPADPKPASKKVPGS